MAKTLFAGDFLGGSLFAGAHRGESMIDVMNCLNIDYSLMGNHEFDYGSDRLSELIDKSNFAWLGSNVRNSVDRTLFHHTKDIDIFEISPASFVGTVRVGIFGVCTEMTPFLADPGDKVVFESALEHCNRCTLLLKSLGCHFIIALTHLDEALDIRVAAIDGIDVIIGGHDHKTVYDKHWGSLLIKCGQDLDQLGILDITFENHTPKPSFTYEFQLQEVQTAERDAIIDAKITHWRNLAISASGGAKDEPICCVDELPLSTLTSDLRHHETAFACCIADCVKWSYREQGCQLAVQNGGFIRRDRVYSVGSVLHTSDLQEELPFPRTPVLIRMTAKEIKLALEQMIARCPEPVGSFPHLSDGWSAAYDLRKPAMERIVALQYLSRPMPLEEETTSYLLAITDFYAEKGGDGVDAYMGKEVVASHGKTVCECAIEYLKSKELISGKLPLRFVAVGEKVLEGEENGMR